MRDPLDQDAGFTLVEVMVAVLILGLALLPIIYGMNATLTGIRAGENTAVAAALLRRVAEETKLVPFADLGDRVWYDYEGTGFDVERQVTVVKYGTLDPGQPEVKQVELRAYRLPRSRYPTPIATWTFLVYRGGI